MPRHPLSTTPAPLTDEHGRVIVDLPCPGCGYLLWQRQVLSGELERLRLARSDAPGVEAKLDPLINTALITLAAARGSGDEEPPVNRLSRPPRPGWLVLAMELALVEHQSYRVELRDGDGRTLWEQDGLYPDAYGTLSVSLHSSFLGPGDYAIELAGVDGGRRAPAGRYRFRVL